MKGLFGAFTGNGVASANRFWREIAVMGVEQHDVSAAV